MSVRRSARFQLVLLQTAGQETVELGANYKMGKNAFSIIMVDAEAVADAGNECRW